MTRRERLAHPLDDVPSIKLKLGFVIAAAVAVTVFVFWVLIKIGVWPSVVTTAMPNHEGSALPSSGM